MLTFSQYHTMRRWNLCIICCLYVLIYVYFILFSLLLFPQRYEIKRQKSIAEGKNEHKSGATRVVSVYSHLTI